jgi:hypothetical protein
MAIYKGASSVELDLDASCSLLARVIEARCGMAAVSQAVAIRRAPAEARPDAFLPGLATSLNNQAAALPAWGGGGRR